MQIYTSYNEAFQACIETQTFSVAHLLHLPHNLNIDTSGCYKIFFPIAGKKKFHIDSHIYDLNFDELFFINLNEWHYFSHFSEEDTHERFVIFIYPDYLRSTSSPNTDLSDCFYKKDRSSAHNITLTAKEKESLLFYLHKLSQQEGYGSDLLEYAMFLEFMVYVNKLFLQHCDEEAVSVNTIKQTNKTVADILTYIDNHLTDDLRIESLAKHFFLSPAYLCKTFKNATGATLHKYITAQRITLAKNYLADGYPIIEVGAMCGFNDYNTFLKAFYKEVGISPKKYSQFSI